jgi:glutathione peroxidase
VSVYDLPLKSIDGGDLDASILRGRASLVVNVASRCGLTAQYAALQALHERYRDRGFLVLGAPCNQFGAQEPGTADEIAEFCSTEYAVTFPLTEKLDVNGPRAHPLYRALTGTSDADGPAGDVQWNFEKFLVSPAGKPVALPAPTCFPTRASSSLRSRPSPRARSRRGCRGRPPTCIPATVLLDSSAELLTRVERSFGQTTCSASSRTPRPAGAQGIGPPAQLLTT